MKTERQRKSVEFTDQDEDFIKRISKDIGCSYCKSNKLTFSLSTFDTLIPNNTSIFAWVHKEETNDFWITTRKNWLDEARNESQTTHFPSDIRGGDCIYFDTKDSYDDTIRVLKLLNKRHSTKASVA
jgi:hypothetical protein